MLKRSRGRSPSPTRGDPSSPPPLDDNPCLPLPKRRRIVGPVIDSIERRDGTTEDDGEDDEDPNFTNATDSANILTSDGKVYEHVNHVLHCLHEEQRHRSRSAQPHLDSSSHGSYDFMTPRDSPSSFSSPLSTPAKYVRGTQPRSSAMSSTRHHGHTDPQETQDNIYGGSHGTALAIPGKAEHKVEDERFRVTQRYEDTNRFVCVPFSNCFH